ncbi:unnamed protein product [Effrenium voratum]|uniref:Uncharacterized protein n=1 Tax=Effrenium voratum TaxID=2562239 RepID=A0AA36HTL0_9DINO|nr:unnamed protein product [Effrenium voratum]CAJ1445805.1 unnamed protein product [Effrenium voratum]
MALCAPPWRPLAKPLVARRCTSVRLPRTSGPFASFETFGWRWSSNHTVDENLLRLALVARFNCFRVANYTTGRCSAMMCRPPRVSGSRVEVEVVGFGVNAPPRFQRARRETDEGGVFPRDVWAGVRPFSRKTPANNEIHSEMSILGRCARAGIPVKGAWFYVALPPCWECCKALVAAGVARVFFKGKGRRGPVPMKLNSKEKRLAEACGMAWVAAEFSVEREEYVEEMWEAYKQESGLDRAAVKAQESQRPLYDFWVTDDSRGKCQGGLWQKIKLPVYAGLWYFFNVQYNIQNKRLLNVFHANWAVSWVQLAAGIPIALLMWGSGFIKAPKLTKDDLLKLAPVGAAFAAGQVATVASLGAVAVSFTHVVKALEPAVNAIASALVLGQVFHPMVYASLLPVFAGVALASSKELSFTMFGFLTAMASNFFFVTRNVLATKFGDVGDMGTEKTERKTNQLAVLTAVAATVLLPVVLVLPGGLLSFGAAWKAALATGVSSHKLAYMMAASGFHFFMYQLSSFWVLSCVPPITHSVLNTLKRVVIIVVSIIVFRTPVTVQSAAGTAVAIGGVLLYSLTKAHYSKKTSEEKSKEVKPQA